METIKEGLDEAYNKAVLNAYFGNGFNAGVEFAERWIPVEEEEPKNREKVLIKWLNDGKEIKSCGSLVIDSHLGKYWQSGGATQIKVTHWRPFERY